MFKEELSVSIGKILMENGHKMIVTKKDCVYFIKRYSQELAFYIRCRDRRQCHRWIEVEMFFMPIVIPDEEVFLSQAGICIQVFPHGNCVGDKMISAGNKIIALEANMANFSELVLRELEEPFFPNAKFPVNKISFLIYNRIKEDESIRQEFVKLERDVCRLMKGKKTKQAYQQCCDFLKQLPSVYFEGKGVAVNPTIDCRRFAEQIYAQNMAGACV